MFFHSYVFVCTVTPVHIYKHAKIQETPRDGVMLKSKRCTNELCRVIFSHSYRKCKENSEKEGFYFLFFLKTDSALSSYVHRLICCNLHSSLESFLLTSLIQPHKAGRGVQTSGAAHRESRRCIPATERQLFRKRHWPNR